MTESRRNKVTSQCCEFFQNRNLLNEIIMPRMLQKNTDTLWWALPMKPRDTDSFPALVWH